MPKQVQKEIQPQPREEEPVDTDVEQRAKVAQETGAAVVGELDDLLDEIDEVLESNAEEFVNAYVQKGGQ
jgi:prokaryotic ubiquitin-like protein Pup